jgi:hypothetical protein
VSAEIIDLATIRGEKRRDRIRRDVIGMIVRVTKGRAFRHDDPRIEILVDILAKAKPRAG